ncbi:hypothetical protein [Caproiciproducens sp.]|uniref:hypothetical protein n=1 Tax=Caproiciproducens sp. TaxID=1954376 RepID=UPI0028999B5E|nr:hypothetical protein [Caproiciproducens sp.]
MNESLYCPYCKEKVTPEDWTVAFESGTTIKCVKCGVAVHEGVENGGDFHERAVSAWERMTNIIKLRFLHDGIPQGREYTYFTPVSVAIGDTVNIDDKKQGIVTQVDIPESEIESFRDKMKTIAGAVPAESEAQ